MTITIGSNQKRALDYSSLQVAPDSHRSKDHNLSLHLGPDLDLRK